MIHQMTKNFSKYSAFLYFFSLFGFSTILKRAGIYKSKGLCSVEMLKEWMVSIMTGKSANKYARSGKALNGNTGTSKSSMYRFMSESSFSWRSFHLGFASVVIARLFKLTDSSRIKTFIIDDSVIDRSRSTHTQLLARVFDHSAHRFLKGFNYLSLAWSDGVSSVPVDFAMMSSRKDRNCLNQIPDNQIDARKTTAKRMIESRKSKPEVVVELLQRILKKGINADYVLFDTWFTTEPLVSKIMKLGLHVIGMVRHMSNTGYRYRDGCCYNMKSLYSKLLRDGLLNTKKEILGSVEVRSKKENIPLKIVFVRNRNDINRYICLLSTDISLTEEEIIRTYARRWSIEVSFYNQKQFLRLESCSANQYSSIIAHTTMVCVCTMMLEFIRRYEKDVRSFGAVFESCAEQLEEIHLNIALDTLMNTFMDYVQALRDRKYLKKSCYEKAMVLAFKMLSSWFTEQIAYIQDFVLGLYEEFATKKTPKLS